MNKDRDRFREPVNGITPVVRSGKSWSGKTGRKPRSAYDPPAAEHTPRKPILKFDTDYELGIQYKDGKPAMWQEVVGEEVIHKAQPIICGNAKDKNEAKEFMEALGVLPVG